MVPVTDFCGVKISRLVIGGNTVSGTSHANGKLDSDLLDYFTTDNIKKMLYRGEEFGINTMQFRGDRHIMRLIREFRLEGGNMNWIAQSAPEMGSFDGNIRQMAACKPVLMYHHGVVTDNFYKAGELDELVRRLKIIRETGVPVGLCTHMPEVMEYSESHHWDVDFYMCCVYNISVPARQEQAKKDGTEEAVFVESDIPVMYQAIRSVNKPCLAFKILGATRRCQNQETVRAAFDECYASIKPADAAVVGMFPRDIDQVALNAGYAEEAIRHSN
jgi:hypothetical protein